MKKLMLMLAFFLLPFSADALEVHISPDAIALGDVVQVQVEGAEEDVLLCTLTNGRKEVFAGERAGFEQGVLHPREEGHYTLTVTCGGEEATASFTVARTLLSSGGETAPAESGLFLEGRVGTVYAQGGLRTVKVLAPGPWTAETEDAFITLYDTCGRSGDALTFLVAPTGEARYGEITLRSGGDVWPLAIRQVAKLPDTVEEELSLTEESHTVLVEGQPFVIREMNGEEMDFAVTASGEWTAATDDAFLSFTQTDDGLSLYADENDTPYARQGSVVLLCGNAVASIYINQPPAPAGADVLSVSVEAENAVAWQDSVKARVLTSSDAQSLTLSMAGHEETFPADGWAKETEEGLVWQVEAPLRRPGKQMLLFAAESKTGSGKKQTAFLQVTEEEAAFETEEAVFTRVGSRCDLAFVTTACAEEVELTDENGRPMAAFARQDAAVQWAGTGAERERYIRWTLPLKADAAPAFVAMGEKRIPVRVRTLLTPSDIALHSQTDGWWRDKKYSISNLETSGCAVFSLSHALQLLGYTGPEIAPENLAKTYAVALMKDGSGTMNSSLVGRAGNDFGFKTRYELYENPVTIRKKAGEGAVFTFSVVNGHIACVAGVTEDGEKCLIIDSAPSATFERKGEEKVYYVGEDGLFYEAAAPGEIPGTVYCMETDSYGCAVYYMDMKYVARRGVRLIQPR